MPVNSEISKSMKLFPATSNKRKLIIFIFIILTASLHIFLSESLFRFQLNICVNIYKSQVRHFLIESSNTRSKLKILPDLREFQWSQMEFLPIPTGAKGSESQPFGPKYSFGQHLVQNKLLIAFSNFMEECGLSSKWFIYGGTLLGSFRHHNNIPWDDDIDILIDKKVKSIIWRRFGILNPEFFLSKSGERDKMHAKLISPPNSSEDIEGSRKLSKYKWGWPFLDLSYYTQNNTHIIEIAWGPVRKNAYNKKDIFPLILRPYNKLWVPTPRNTFKVIKEMYPSSSNCIESSYSHIFERGKGGKSIDCRLLAQRYSFVRRLPLFADYKEFNDEDDLDWILELLIRETNTSGVEVVHELLLVAPRLEARVNTYSLELTTS